MVDKDSVARTPDEFAGLLIAMNWVIPRDQTAGAGTEACAAHLIDLIGSKGETAILRYRESLPTLTEADLDDNRNPFAQEFIEDVKNCYYGYADTSAWEDIQFEVTA